MIAEVLKHLSLHDMKKQSAEKFNEAYKILGDLVKKHRWIQLSSDPKVGCFSMEDPMSVVRLDIYVTKMTVCFMSKECKTKYYKKMTTDKIEQIMLAAYDILWE